MKINQWIEVRGVHLHFSEILRFVYLPPEKALFSAIGSYLRLYPTGSAARIPDARAIILHGYVRSYHIDLTDDEAEKLLVAVKEEDRQIENAGIRY